MSLQGDAPVDAVSAYLAAQRVNVLIFEELADEGTIDRKIVADAIKKYALDPAKPNPMTV